MDYFDNVKGIVTQTHTHTEAPYLQRMQRLSLRLHCRNVIGESLLDADREALSIVKVAPR